MALVVMLERTTLQNVDDAASQDNQTEPLRRRKIREEEDSETSRDNDIGVNYTAPLFFARSNPCWPAFCAIRFGAPNAKDKMNHGIDCDADADVSGRRRDHVHGDMEPANATEHA